MAAHLMVGAAVLVAIGFLAARLTNLFCCAAKCNACQFHSERTKPLVVATADELYMLEQISAEWPLDQRRWPEPGNVPPNDFEEALRTYARLADTASRRWAAAAVVMTILAAAVLALPIVVTLGPNYFHAWFAFLDQEHAHESLADEIQAWIPVLSVAGSIVAVVLPVLLWNAFDVRATDLRVAADAYRREWHDRRATG